MRVALAFSLNLLRMAMLEAQAIASRSGEESDKPPCDADDSSYDTSSSGDLASPSFQGNR